jgi:CRP-like cAMP-binding protein
MTRAPRVDAFGLDDAPRELRSRVQPRTLAKGETLFHAGDAATAVYVIQQGRVAMVRHGPEGRRVTLFVGRAGDAFAEAALFSDVYHCDAVAETAARVLVVPKAALRGALASHRGLRDTLTARLARQVLELRQRLALRDIRGARQRVLQWLTIAADTTGAVACDRPLKAVAEEIGLTPEAFYRALAALARDGRLSRRGRRLTVRPGKT